MRLFPIWLLAIGAMGCGNTPPIDPAGLGFPTSASSQTNPNESQQKAIQAQLNSTTGAKRAALQRKLQGFQTQNQATPPKRILRDR